MEKLNLLLILLLSFFVLHLYSAQNNQQKLPPSEAPQKSVPLSSSGGVAPDDAKEKKLQHLSYTKNRLRTIGNYSPSKLKLWQMYVLIPFSPRKDSIYDLTPAFKHLDYQIPSATTRDGDRDFSDYEGLYYITTGNICQDRGKGNLYSLPVQQILLLQEYISIRDGYEYGKGGFMLSNKADVNTSLYKD